jgi:serine/threonine-protein kinase
MPRSSVTLDHLSDAPPVAQAAPVRQRSWLAMGAAVAGVSGLVALAIGATLALNRPAQEVYRLAVITSEDQPFNPSVDRNLDITPDGRHLIYRASIDGVVKLVVRDLNQGGGRVLEGTDGARSPFVSPDGQWIGYFSTGALKKTALTGGAPLTICVTDGGGARGASWQGDRIAFATATLGAGLKMVPAAGGEPTELTHPDEAAQEGYHAFPTFTPDGSHVSRPYLSHSRSCSTGSRN